MRKVFVQNRCKCYTFDTNAIDGWSGGLQTHRFPPKNVLVFCYVSCQWFDFSSEKISQGQKLYTPESQGQKLYTSRKGVCKVSVQVNLLMLSIWKTNGSPLLQQNALCITRVFVVGQFIALLQTVLWTQKPRNLSILFRLLTRLHQPHAPREQLLHHALLDGAGFVATLLQRGNLGIHV